MLKKHLLQICICLLPCFVIAQTFNGTAGTIPDNNTWKTFACNVSGLNPNLLNTTFGFEKLTMSISHNNVSDLEVRLQSPNGTEVLICKNVGGTGNNFTNTGFKNDYTAPITNGIAPFNGSYKPQGDLGAFNNGQNGNGVWYLRVKDGNLGFSGSVTAFSLRFGNGPAQPNLTRVEQSTDHQNQYRLGLLFLMSPKSLRRCSSSTTAPGQRNYSNDSVYQYKGQIGIERRGSSSGGMPKKSYGFETWNGQGVEIDTTLLGMPSQSDWILSASYADKSLMRNVLSYDIFNKMGHYASRTTVLRSLAKRHLSKVFIF
jgi:subtilisin-like proprotein convertase family protein